ncbi:MAG: hypothetical protein AAB649_05730, partial [Patescibacteria group bacterium]
MQQTFKSLADISGHGHHLIFAVRFKSLPKNFEGLNIPKKPSLEEVTEVLKDDALQSPFFRYITGELAESVFPRVFSRMMRHANMWPDALDLYRTALKFHRGDTEAFERERLLAELQR